MKKTYIYTIITLALCCFYSVFFAIAKESPVTFSREKIIIQTSKVEQTYNVEIAITNEQLEVGLMFRESLPKNDGMLFIFNNEQKVNMWMKNTLIPLDILFIDKLGKIIYIAQNAKPNSLDIINAGNVAVRAVLELGGGATKENNINIGDKIIYKVFEK